MPNPEPLIRALFGSAARWYGSTVTGNRRTLTEEDLTPAEMKLLRETIQESLAKQAGFGSFPRFLDTYRKQNQQPGIATQNQALTFGTATLARSKEGEVVVRDRYDFSHQGMIDQLRKDPLSVLLAFVNQNTEGKFSLFRDLLKGYAVEYAGVPEDLGGVASRESRIVRVRTGIPISGRLSELPEENPSF